MRNQRFQKNIEKQSDDHIASDKDDRSGKMESQEASVQTDKNEVK